MSWFSRLFGGKEVSGSGRDGADPVCTIIILESSSMESAALVQSIVSSLSIRGGKVSTFYGPPRIDEGLARAMLARFDNERGTDYLGRRIEFGTGQVAGGSFSFIKIL